MSAKFLFFSFAGRISRLYWWLGMLAVELTSLSVTMALLWLMGEDPTFYWNDEPPNAQTALAEIIAFLLTLRVALAIDIKRIHDRGRSAYLLVPLYLTLLMLIAFDATGSNPLFVWPDEQELHAVFPVFLLARISLMIAFMVYIVWLVFELGFRKGIAGPTKYGADPLAPLTPPNDETI